MSTSTKAVTFPEPVAARVADETLYVELADGRTLGVPISWYPRLAHGTRDERNHMEIGRMGIHWPDLDEDISVENIMRGTRSGEGPRSFARWLMYRAKGELPPVPTLPLPADES